MRTRKRLWLAAVSLGAVISAAQAQTESTTDTEDPTRQQLQTLDQKVRVLERRIELQNEAAAAALQKAPTVSVSEKGMSIKLADGAYELKLRGTFQVDARIFSEEDAPDDSFVLRRLRPTFEFGLGKLVSARLMPEFAGDSASVVDAYIDVKASPYASVRAGKFKGPLGLERLQSASAIAFAERAYPTELVPNRDIGLQIWADLFDERFSYALAFTNGTPDGRDAASANPDDDFETSLRLFVQPVDGLGFGIAGSISDKRGNGNAVLPRYRSPGQQTIYQYSSAVLADGEHTRWSPQAYVYRGPFGLLGEYVESRQSLSDGITEHELKHQAWQISTSWVLSGEDASYKGVKPDSPVGAGGYGAWELVLRYTEVDFDDAGFGSFASVDTAVSEAQSWIAGLNWSLTTNLKAVLNYAHTRFDGGSTAGADRSDEDLVFGRLQLAF